MQQLLLNSLDQRKGPSLVLKMTLCPFHSSCTTRQGYSRDLRFLEKFYSHTKLWEKLSILVKVMYFSQVQKVTTIISTSTRHMNYMHGRSIYITL